MLTQRPVRPAKDAAAQVSETILKALLVSEEAADITAKGVLEKVSLRSKHVEDC